MSVNYASGLSYYPDKGKCGLPETVDDESEVEVKIKQLAELIKSSKHFIVFTGAGISTSIGIPDFRGPNGVWTLEQKGQDLPPSNTNFNNAKPSLTHLALNELEFQGYLKFVVTQNVDGIHLRSGFPRNRLSILHGDMFIEECNTCKTQYIRQTAIGTMGKKLTGNICSKGKSGRVCRGKLIDTVLDWEDNLPDKDYELAQLNALNADLILCLGTSLQIEPAGSIPVLSIRQYNKKLSVLRKQNMKKEQIKEEMQEEPVLKMRKAKDEEIKTEFDIENKKQEPKIDNTNDQNSNSSSKENSELIPLPAKLVIVNLQKTKHDKHCTLRIFHKVDYVMSRICELLNIKLPNIHDFTSHKTVIKSKHTVDEKLPWKIEHFDPKLNGKPTGK